MTLHTGQMLSHYRLVEQIGEGSGTLLNRPWGRSRAESGRRDQRRLLLEFALAWYSRHQMSASFRELIRGIKYRHHGTA